MINVGKNVSKQVSELKADVTQRAINVMQPPYNAKGDGVTDDTAAIQSAINYVSSLGGGTVLFPSGTYIISNTVKLKTNVVIEGVGYSSVIKLQNNSTCNTYMIGLYDTDQIFVGVKNLKVDGNKDNQTLSVEGIYLKNTISGDHYHLVENVYITNIHGTSVHMGTTTRECRFIKVVSRSSGNIGFLLECTDSMFTNCTSANSWNNGFQIEQGNNKLTACKAFFAGQSGVGSGFVLKNTTIQLTNCESQENGLHGFHLQNATGVVLSSCIADSNGTMSTGYGIYLQNSNFNNIVCAVYNHSWLTGKHQYMVCCTSDAVSKYNTIDVNGSTDDKVNKPLNLVFNNNITNDVKINGFNMLKLNVLDERTILTDADADGMADMFAIKLADTNITGAVSLNTKENTQIIQITASPVANSSSGYLVGTTQILCAPGDIIQAKALVNFSGTNMEFRIGVDYYNSSNVYMSTTWGTISAPTIDYDFFDVIDTAPTGSAKFRINLKLIVKVANAVGIANIKKLYVNRV